MKRYCNVWVRRCHRNSSVGVRAVATVAASNDNEAKEKAIAEIAEVLPEIFRREDGWRANGDENDVECEWDPFGPEHKP